MYKKLKKFWPGHNGMQEPIIWPEGQGQCHAGHAITLSPDEWYKHGDKM